MEMMKMKPRELMGTLVKHEDVMIDALALSLRNIKYGKGERAFFDSNEELVAALDFLFGQMMDDTDPIYGSLTQIKYDLKDGGEVNQDALTRLENAVFSEVKTCLNLLANIAKAKESVEFQEIWKEKQNGNGEEANNSDEEV